MAEIAQGGGGGHDKGGKVRTKKASTRIDMTPMVDLGFLLITFFILATTLSKPSSMSVAVPDKQQEKVETEPLKASKVLTLFLGKDNTVWALDRLAADDDKAKAELKKVSYGQDLRSVILQSKAAVDREHGKDAKGESQFVVVIKPLPNSTYKNTVDALDEMAITKSKRYALVDALMTPEKELLGDKVKD